MKPAQLKILAHRGASADAPENTMAAFKLALAQHAHGIECDLRLSSDNEPVIIHDTTLHRTTGVSSAVHNLTAAQLTTLDNGSWFAPEFADERIPLLNELLQWAPPELELRLELKHGSPAGSRCLARCVAAVLRNHRRQNDPRICISSFNPLVLFHIWQECRELPIARLFSRHTRSVFGRYPLVEFIPGLTGVDVPLAETLAGRTPEQWQRRFGKWRRRRLELTAWTGDDPQWREALLEAGFQGVITNVPALWLETSKNACNS